MGELNDHIALAWSFPAPSARGGKIGLIKVSEAMMSKHLPWPGLTLALLLSAPVPTEAFVLTQFQWDAPLAVYYTGIEGVSPGGESWSLAFQEAMRAWRENTIFDLVVESSSLDPCAVIGGQDGDDGERSDGRAGIGFTDDQCGSAYGLGVLAVTQFQGDLTDGNFGGFTLRETDIMFNDNLNWDIYNGSLRFEPGLGRVYDFSRVALHEIGHSLGLGHETFNQAIMQPSISSRFTLSKDDIAGIAYLYGGPVTVDSIYGIDVHAPAGAYIGADTTLRITGALTAGADKTLDVTETLTANDLTTGQYIAEVQEFTLKYRSQVAIELSSLNFEPFFYLARRTINQEIVADSLLFDDAPSPMQASVSRTLDAGTYWIMVINCTEVTGSGDYRLSVAATVLDQTRSFPTFVNEDGATVEINSNPHLRGTLSDGDFRVADLPVDIYQFELSRPQSRLKIYAHSTAIDTFLRLRTAPGTGVPEEALYFENDDVLASATFTTHSEIEATLPAGTYWLEVTLYDNGFEDRGLRGDYAVDTFVQVSP